MPIIRRKLASSDIYPDDIRYNSGTDTVQSLVNGDWVDNPLVDPRRNTTLPPRLTADTACDAAQSVTDALEGQISDILIAIDNAANAFTIAGLILSLLSFGVFAVFISIALVIANAMLDAGSASLAAALTPGVFEQFKCILFCQMDEQGRIDAAGLANVQVEVSAEIGGLGATILNAMTSLAGEGGINNLGSLGTATGDCSACGCEPPCPDPDNFFAGTITSSVENPDGSWTFEVDSVDNGAGTHYIMWGEVGVAACCCITEWVVVVAAVPEWYYWECDNQTGTPDFIGGFSPSVVSVLQQVNNSALGTPFSATITVAGTCP